MNEIVTTGLEHRQDRILEGEVVFAPLCVWCGAEWSDDNLKVYAYSGGSGCDTCGYGSEPYGSVKIVCSACDKLMYEKEFEG